MTTNGEPCCGYCEMPLADDSTPSTSLLGCCLLTTQKRHRLLAWAVEQAEGITKIDPRKEVVRSDGVAAVRAVLEVIQAMREEG